MKFIDGAIEKAGDLADTARNGARKVGRVFWWSGFVATRAATVVVAAVPGAALVAKGIDAVSTAVKGHELSGGVLDNVHELSGSLAEDTSLAARLNGVALETYATPVAIADSVSDWGGEVVGAFTHGHEMADRVGQTAANAAVAYGAYVVTSRVAKSMPQIPRPTRLPSPDVVQTPTVIPVG